MMPNEKRENRVMWAAECARTFLLFGEKHDGDPLKRGVRLGVLANRVSRRYRLTDDEALVLARRALALVVEAGHATIKDGVFHATMKLARRAPHEGLDIVLRARQWRVLGYKLPSGVPDHMNVKDVHEADDGTIQYEVVRD